MDFSNIYTQSKCFFNYLLKTYEKFLFERLHGVANYFNGKKEITNSIRKQQIDSTSESRKNSAVTEIVVQNNFAGIPHLEAISNLLNKPIELYDEKELLKLTLGNTKNNVKPIKIQYHKNLQHYTLLGGREPYASARDCMCLYNCISDHTFIDPNVLKNSAIEQLKISGHRQAYKDIDLCLGGATYTGQGARDAGWYLDNCQGKQGHKFPNPAHPRGHASNPGGVGVEKYSSQGMKTGFDSYREQDFVAHYALDCETSRRGMDALNRGSVREVVHLAPYELSLPRPVPAGTWVGGSKTESFDVGVVTIVMQHYQGEYQNASAPVFIQTIYPRHPNM